MSFQLGLCLFQWQFKRFLSLVAFSCWKIHPSTFGRLGAGHDVCRWLMLTLWALRQVGLVSSRLVPSLVRQWSDRYSQDSWTNQTRLSSSQWCDLVSRLCEVRGDVYPILVLLGYTVLNYFPFFWKSLLAFKRSKLWRETTPLRRLGFGAPYIWKTETNQRRQTDKQIPLGNLLPTPLLALSTVPIYFFFWKAITHIQTI